MRRRSDSGLDKIPIQALHNLPEAALSKLLQWYNQIWETGFVPHAWKLAWVVHLHKPGQSPRIHFSYRSVSLTSSVAKLMERMVHSRLPWFLESRRLTPNAMYGFRRNLCTLGCILDLGGDLNHQYDLKKNSADVFLDIKTANDNVSSLVRVRSFEELGVTGRAQVFISDFLYHRDVRVPRSGES